MTALAGEGQKIFMVAIPALHQGKAVGQVATIQVEVNNLLEIRPPVLRKGAMGKKLHFLVFPFAVYNYGASSEGKRRNGSGGEFTCIAAEGVA